MTPADVDALLRIKQVRERRVRAELEKARKAERDAVAERTRAEGARDSFAVMAQLSRERAYSKLEQLPAVGAWPLQAVAADLAGLRAQSAGLAQLVNDAGAVEADRHTEAQRAAKLHGAAQRHAEAFEMVAKEVKTSAVEAAEHGEELEQEDLIASRSSARA